MGPCEDGAVGPRERPGFASSCGFLAEAFLPSSFPLWPQFPHPRELWFEMKRHSVIVSRWSCFGPQTLLGSDGSFIQSGCRRQLGDSWSPSFPGWEGPLEGVGRRGAWRWVSSGEPVRRSQRNPAHQAQAGLSAGFQGCRPPSGAQAVGESARKAG